jgi:hypothetical protein
VIEHTLDQACRFQNKLGYDDSPVVVVRRNLRACRDHDNRMRQPVNSYDPRLFIRPFCTSVIVSV